MPRIMRRTPTTEKAMDYGYRGFLQDIVAQAGRSVERMTSGELGKEELLEMALAPAGGMLKMTGLGRLLPQVIKLEQAAQKSLNRYIDKRSLYRREIADRARKVWLETLKVPEKEYGRIKDIKWDPMRGPALGTKGLYDPSTKEILLHSQLKDPGTVWHEFTHARQWSPEKGEEAAAGTLRMLNQRLAAASERGWEDFYRNISPLEKHARNVAMTMTTGSKSSEFNRIYKGLLESALLGAEEGLTSREIKEVWGLFLKKQARGIEGRVGEIADLMRKFRKESTSVIDPRDIERLENILYNVGKTGDPLRPLVDYFGSTKASLIYEKMDAALNKFGTYPTSNKAEELLRSISK